MLELSPVLPVRPAADVIARVERSGPCTAIWLHDHTVALRHRPNRRFDCIKMLALARGRATVQTTEARVELAPGTFVWLDADRDFDLTITSGAPLLVEWSASALHHQHPAIDTRTGILRGTTHAGEEALSALLHGIAKSGDTMSPANAASAVRVLVEAVGLCSVRLDADARDARVARALARIDASLASQALSPDLLAEQLRTRRLDRAAADLRARPDLNVEQVARRVGFADGSHFTRAFRQRFGVPPSVFRRTRK